MTVWYSARNGGWSAKAVLALGLLAALLVAAVPAALVPIRQPKITAFMKQEMAGKGATVNFLLEPFMRVHLYSEYVGFEPGVSITSIYILAGVALLILVIACSTYINLSTARSVERAREVGVRKVIGAGKGQLFWQFIGESLLLCLAAVILSLVVAALALPAFDQLADRQRPARSDQSARDRGASCQCV